MIYVYRTDELYHHGIKGQRWGVRRYQNADGSLTEEGYQHWGLNPDGSRFRGKRDRKQYSDSTVSTFKKGTAIGAAVGSAAGALTGPGGIAIGSAAGMAVGSAAGMAVGAYKTHKMRKKIRKLLSENGKVYVKDLV